MEAYRVALDTVWDWAEMRGVRVDFWRNDDSEWEVMVTLRDTHGNFSGSTPLPIFRPSKGTRGKFTQTELRDAYTKSTRAALDATVVKARAERANWHNRGRLN